jgi:hypothetical protein
LPENTGHATADGRRSSAWTFFALVFALSIPFWIVGAVTGYEFVSGLPLAALMGVCPAIAALILTAREGGAGAVRALLSRIVDAGKVSVSWLLLIVAINAAIWVLSFAILRATGVPVPPPHVSPAMIALVFIVFFLFAIGEELGWSRYAIDSRQEHRSELRAALMLGVIWASWHLLPLVQVHRAPVWIAWWCLGTVGMRVIMVRIYNATSGSVFSAILYHALANLAWLTFPVMGSYFDPRVNGLLVASVAVLVMVFSGARSLRRNGTDAKR